MATEGTILRLRELALIEDASPDNVVNLTPVTEGVDGSAAFGIGNEANQIELGAGQFYIDRVNPDLSVVCLKPDSADVTQIESWVDNLTDIYVSAITVDGGFLIGDKETTTGAVKLVANEDLTDNDVYAFNIQKQTPPGFDPSSGLYQDGFWIGKNLLGAYEWGDKVGNNIADGWTSILTSTTFSSGQQTLTTDGSGVQYFRRDVYLPISGQSLTFSIDVDTYNTIDSFDIRLQLYDSSESLLQQATTAITSTGRKSVTIETTSNTVIIRSRVVLDNTTTGTTVSEVISDPALKLGTDSTYTKY